jgi:hypothetical protein
MFCSFVATQLTRHMYGLLFEILLLWFISHKDIQFSAYCYDGDDLWSMYASFLRGMMAEFENCQKHAWFWLRERNAS